MKWSDLFTRVSSYQGLDKSFSIVPYQKFVSTIHQSTLSSILYWLNYTSLYYHGNFWMNEIFIHHRCSLCDPSWHIKHLLQQINEQIILLCRYSTILQNYSLICSLTILNWTFLNIFKCFSLYINKNSLKIP